MARTEADDTLDAAAPPGAVSLAELQPGEIVGRYRVLERVGAGGMGLVYRALDPQLRREVALKLVKPEHMQGRGGPAHRARLLREARAMAQLGHPNVVRVFDVGEHDDGVFLAMEFVQGPDAHRWARHERPPWPRIVAVYRAAGRGLAAAHAAGLIHRDFKPANVLVGDDNRVRVMDFGLARTAEDIGETHLKVALEDDAEPESPAAHREAANRPDLQWSEAVTTDGVVVGTPAYMAPEQFTGLPADTRSDQYAYCVSLWEALFSTLPFAGRNPRAVGAAKALDELRGPPADTDVPEALIDALRRGLSADPEQRFEGMPDVLRALRGVAEEAEAAPAASQRRGVPWLVVGAVAVAIAGAWFLAREDPCEAHEVSDALRAEYTRAVASGHAAEAQAAASRLAEHWDGRGCVPLHREWSALSHAGS